MTRALLRAGSRIAWLSLLVAAYVGVPVVVFVAAAALGSWVGAALGGVW